MINAQYTVVLKTLMDNAETMAELEKAMSTYPLYVKKSEEVHIPSIVPTREQLNKKILDHYKYREIGFETIGRFLDELEISLNEIMPRYNQLFFSADLDYEVLYNVDYERTTTTTKSGTTSSSLSGESETTDSASTTGTTSDNSTTGENGKNVSSQTPQGQLSITASAIDSVSYADNVQWNNGNRTTSNTGSTSTTSSGGSVNSNSATTSGTTSDSEDTVETTKGNFGVMATQDLVRKYRELIINIEEQLINDKRIKELFMLVW